MRVVGSAAALLGFVWFFDESRPQLAIDSLWLLALLLWILQFPTRHTSGPRRSIAFHAPLLILLAVFTIAWLPFYDSWRWAYTADSLDFFRAGQDLATQGLRRNLLSVHGIDNFYTHLWEVSYNLGMLVLGPTFFAHRLGLLLMAMLALATTYLFYALVFERGWALVITAATACNYVWLWMSYVSYLRMDGIVFFYAMLICGYRLWQRPHDLSRYMACGLIAGLSAFYTPAAWATLAFVVLAALALSVATQQAKGGSVLLFSIALAALPVLLELPWLLSMMRTQSLSPSETWPQWSYVWDIFRQLLWSPYDSRIDRMGAHGAFLPIPLGALYLIGLGLGLISLVSPLRSRLRIPAGAAPLFLLLLWNVTLFAFTNKGYPSFSHKRTYVLIPLQVFFALLPAIVAMAWAESPAARRIAVAAIGIALVVYAAGSFTRILKPAPYMYGTNVFDGMVELRQRWPERPVTLLTARPELFDAFRPDQPVPVAYRVLDTVRLDSQFSDANVEAACQHDRLICYEPAFDQERFQVLLDRHPQLRAFPLLNSYEAACYGCDNGR